jgi:2,5-diketo-D-gluconate reductase A
LVQRDVLVIPKSVRRERMAENLDIIDFELTEEEMARIATVDEGTSHFFSHYDAEIAGRFGGVRMD